MKKVFRCCFPSNKELVSNLNEETQEFKFHLNDKKSNIENIDKTFDEPLEKSHKKKDSNYLAESLLRNNLQKPEHMDDSFSSFAIQKQGEVNGHPKKNSDPNSRASSINNIKQFKNSNIDDNTVLNIRMNNSPNSMARDDGMNGRYQVDDRKDFSMPSGRIISDTDIMASPTLKVEEVYGDILKNQRLKINASGLTTSLRKANDGVTFFGKNNKNGLIDFELNYDGWHNISAYIFIIFYRKENKKYYIKSNPDHKHLAGNVIIRLNSTLYFPLIKNQKILISEHLFDVSPINDGKLEILIINGNSDNKANAALKKECYDPNEINSVTVGRDKAATIYLKDKGFSKIHTSFLWNWVKKFWELKDGNEEQPSTNGTWIYAESSYEICDDTVIEVGSSKLRISLIENY